MATLTNEIAKAKVRPLYEIATEIKSNWKLENSGTELNYGAVPYLDAMSTLDKIEDDYFMDSGKSIVIYFLSNASTWRGTKAKEIKKELKAMAGLK